MPALAAQGGDVEGDLGLDAGDRKLALDHLQGKVIHFVFRVGQLGRFRRAEYLLAARHVKIAAVSFQRLVTIQASRDHGAVVSIG
jgi:hypothetical protein